MEFCNLKAQYQEYRSELQAAINQVLESAAFVGGPQVAEFEHKLSEFVGAEAITCANGTDALQLALIAAGIGPGDEVITTPFTFIATAEMIAMVGAKPIFCDISRRDFNIDASQISSHISERTKAILAVSLYGQCANFAELQKVSEANNLLLLEDGAQSFGATWYGQRSCGITKVATTSFFPAKPLGCYGDGGAVFTKDIHLAQALRTLRNHGQKERYRHHVVGVNSRLDTIQAAILLVKLQHYEKELTRRQQLAMQYSQALAPLENTGLIELPRTAPECSSVWAQYTLRVKNRDHLQSHLQSHGIPTAIHYPLALHLQPCFLHLGGKSGQFPVAEQASLEVLSLPMSSHLQEAEQNLVIETIFHAYN